MSVEEIPPSKTIYDITALLHGLTFGEHDAGVQRKALTQRLAPILSLWASGLLAADFPRSELQKVQSNFDELILSSASHMLIWHLLPLPDLDCLVQFYWTHAASYLTDLPSTSIPPTSASNPIFASLRAIRIANHILEAAAAKDNRRSAATKTASGSLLFTIIRLQQTLFLHPTHYPSAFPEVENALTYLSRMRRVPQQSLIPTVHAALLAALSPALETETAQVDPTATASTFHLAPATSVLHSIAAAIPSGPYLEAAAPGLLNALLPLAEHVHTSTRAEALITITSLVDRLPKAYIPAPEIANAVKGAMLWRDIPSTRAAIPLLQRLLPHLRESVGLRAVDNMKDVVKRVMDNVMHHMAARVQAPGEERHRHVSVPDVVVATEFVCIVPEMARERLIQMTHVWMPALASFLPQVVVLVAQGKVDVGGGLAVGNALVESLKWAWIGIDSFRTVIFEACVSAIMEARACTSEDQDAIRASVRIVLLYLARCGRKHVTLQIVGQIITTATDYPSLREAKDYFEQIETVISTEPSNGISKKFAGELLSKFFPELCKSSELTSP